MLLLQSQLLKKRGNCIKMILDPTPATLFCGMGEHARSVFLYLNKYALQKIYIIYAKYNTKYYEAKISLIKQEINTRLEALDHIVKVNYIQINEPDFLQSYYSIARLFNQEKDKYIITDLTAGRKIISYIIYYAYMFMRFKFSKESKLIYIWVDDDTPLNLPNININMLNDTLNNFLKDIDYYNSHDLVVSIPNEYGTDEEIKELSLSKYLTEGHAFSGKKYRPASISRYKKKLHSKGFLDNNLKLTIESKMYLFAIEI